MAFNFTHQIQGACDTDQIIGIGDSPGFFEGLLRFWHHLHGMRILPGNDQEIVRTHGTIGRGRRQDQQIRKGSQPFHHCRVIFILKDTEDHDQFPPRERSLQGIAKHGNRGRIMRAVEDKKRTLRHRFEAAGPIHGCNTDANRMVVNRETS